MKKIKKFLTQALPYLIIGGTALLCSLFICLGTQTENGYITLDGKDAEIGEYTEKFIEDANDALYRIMNSPATDDETISQYEDIVVGQGSYTTIDQVLNRRKPDGDKDGGNGWQCSKYTAYLATGKKDYSSKNPDYGPVHGKNIASWLVNNHDWKYISEPVEGAIGSGGFNTKYGHTAMFLYSTGSNTAMVSDANYIPLTVSTHNMNISGWVWVVPSNYNPKPTPTPEPTPTPVSDCKTWNVKRGDTMGKIMKACEGKVNWSKINDYAKSWKSTKVKPNQTVYDGWNSLTGVGLYAGDVIRR